MNDEYDEKMEAGSQTGTGTGGADQNTGVRPAAFSDQSASAASVSDVSAASVTNASETSAQDGNAASVPDATAASAEHADYAATIPNWDNMSPLEKIKAMLELEKANGLGSDDEDPDDAGSDTGYDEYIDYKARMKELRANYKARKKAEKAAKRSEVQYGKPRTGLTVVISVVTTLLCLGLFGAFLLYFPTKNNSYFNHLVKKYVSTNSRSNAGISIDGKTVDPASQITINVDGDNATSAVYAKASRSVVGISVVQLSGSRWETQTETVISQGSGIIYTADGEIMTNFHVVESAVDTAKRAIGSSFKVYVYFDTSLDDPYEVVNLIGYDADCDIALLKVDASGLTPMEFADSDTLEVGQTVVAIGSPGGLAFMNSVSEGVISGLHRNITSSSTGVTVYDLLQTTAAINPGNSGGALLTTEGKLAGVCVIKIVSDSYESMGFAITSNAAGTIAESLEKYGRYVKPLLGVEIDTRYDAQAARNAGWAPGAFVNSVSEGSCADKAGVKAEDVICDVDGNTVTDYYVLRRVLLKYSPGDTVTVKVYRPSEDKYIDFTVVLDAS